LGDLVLYGIIVIQPVAPMSSFGVLSDRGRGHVVTAILLAMLGMLCTAVSYGRMARAYPSAGSAFTYVGKELHPALGFITGWSMVLDYLLNPLICIVWCSSAIMGMLPGLLPEPVWKVLFFLLFTATNLRGIEASARVNSALALVMGLVIVLFFFAAVRYLLRTPQPPSALTIPFYDPRTFKLGDVLGATSLAVLTYIGFDGISTLSEEAENPRRNIMLATILTCLAIGILASVQVYLAQLVWPAHEPFPDKDTAFIHVAGRAGGPLLFTTITITLLVANVGSGIGAQLGAARLLYGMGRSNALPPRIFAAVDPKRRIPRNNVLLVGALALIGAFLLSFERGAELLNFGALIAFMGVNLAAFLHTFVRARERRFDTLVPPLVGFGICLMLWISLRTPAKLIGLTWLVLGLAYGAWKTRWFRADLVSFEAPPDDR
jgi:putrescine importer